MMDESLAGWRILVVEDEMLIAVVIEQELQDLGCIVIGPAGKLDVALRLSRDSSLDAAVLDVNIRGGDVYPVAEILAARGIPFVLASGYGAWALPEAMRHQPLLNKPFTMQDMTNSLRALRRPQVQPA